MKRFMRAGAAFGLGLALSVVAWAGLETVTHIQDLNASWPLGSDLASTSDDHVRNIKSALKTDFPNFNGTYTSAALPVFAIPSDTNTGIYSVAADDLGFSTGGTKRFDISTTAFTGTLPWLGQDGAVGTPALTFSADPDTGLYRPATNTLALAAGGAIAATFTNTTNSSAHEFGIQDGLVSLPGLFFASDTNTGLYSATADDLAVTAGGVLAAQFRNVAGAVKLLGADGTAPAPYFTYDNDPDTGFYRDTANQIGIALGGSTAGQIAQGTFTGTLTGYAANPTGTVNYQRIGNIVTLWTVNPISGTSNATSFTMTGLPALVTPTNTAQTMVFVVTDNGASATAHATVNGSGVVNFFKAASLTSYSSSGWTGSATKGVPTGWTITYPLE